MAWEEVFQSIHFAYFTENLRKIVAGKMGSSWDQVDISGIKS
jgi:hypothetical protein